jgi:hypothetical protein
MIARGAAGTARPMNWTHDRRGSGGHGPPYEPQVGLKADLQVRDPRRRGWHSPSLPAMPQMPPNHRAHHARRMLA